MSSGDRKKQSTMSFLVGAVGRAVISGLAFYGAKKLYEDYWKGGAVSGQAVEEKPTKGPGDSESETEEDTDIDIRPDSHRQAPPVNLLKSLEDYFESYVKPSMSEVETARKVVAELEEYVLEMLDQSCPELPIGKLIHTGSAYEDLQVITPDDFDTFLQLRLDSSQWELIDGKDTLLDSPGYALVKRSNQEFFKVGSVPWDRFLVGYYLSPQKILQYFQALLQRSVGPGKKRFTIEPSVKENSLSVTVIYGSDQKLRLNIIPMVKIGDVTMAGRLHPKFALFGMDGYKNLWRRSYVEEEEAMMKSLTSQNGCQKDCLRILKAISMNDYGSPLHLVEPYVFKTILFHLSQIEENWDKQVLAERVIDMFMVLDRFLDQRKLPNYFNGDVNLFESYTDIYLRELKHYVNHVITRNKFSTLLRQKSPGKDF